MRIEENEKKWVEDEKKHLIKYLKKEIEIPEDWSLVIMDILLRVLLNSKILRISNWISVTRILQIISFGLRV